MRPPFALGGREVSIGLSIGIALAPSDGCEPDDLFKKADLALYRAKNEGRNTFRFYEAAMDEAVQARLELDLSGALGKNEFKVHYQPILHIASRALSGFEALVRWRHPERGLVSPGDFVPIAEETGLIVSLGDWVLREACTQAVLWPSDLRVAVNISAVQFQQEGFVGVPQTSGQVRQFKQSRQ